MIYSTHAFLSARWQKYTAFTLVGILCLISVAACGVESELPPPPPTPVPPKVETGSCSLDLAADASDEESIKAALLAEGQFTVGQDINALMLLWSEGGRVVDAKHTEDESDDQIWLNKDAIRHRYVRVVFPGAPSNVQPTDMNVQILENQAVVQSTTQIGDEWSPAGDRWELRKWNDCWHLQQLTYNLEEEPQQ